jgi:hypothetical protein
MSVRKKTSQVPVFKVGGTYFEVASGMLVAIVDNEIGSAGRTGRFIGRRAAVQAEMGLRREGPRPPGRAGPRASLPDRGRINAPRPGAPTGGPGHGS